MTQKEALELVLSEIKHIKTHMPNGELKQMQRDMGDMKDDISDLKYTLLNPDNGVIVSTNKNTDLRVEMQANEKDFRNQMLELEELKRWKNGVTKALWIIFGTIVIIIFQMLTQHGKF